MDGLGIPSCMTWVLPQVWQVVPGSSLRYDLGLPTGMEGMAWVFPLVWQVWPGSSHRYGRYGLGLPTGMAGIAWVFSLVWQVYHGSSLRYDLGLHTGMKGKEGMACVSPQVGLPRLVGLHEGRGTFKLNLSLFCYLS